MGQNTTSVNTQNNNFDSCSTSFKLYGYVELLGGAALGLALMIIVALSIRPLWREAQQADARQDALEASSLKHAVP